MDIKVGQVWQNKARGWYWLVVDVSLDGFLSAQACNESGEIIIPAKAQQKKDLRERFSYVNENWRLISQSSSRQIIVGL